MTPDQLLLAACLDEETIAETEIKNESD